jgi:hypothetical protein
MAENGSLETAGGKGELGACPICRGQEGWSRTLKCEGIIFWTRGSGMSKQT